MLPEKLHSVVPGLKTFEDFESNVRSYSRSFPAVFGRSWNSTIESENGDEYIDFLSGAGALNYGHNNPVLRDVLVEYLACDGVTHGLDMATIAKREFIEAFESIVLRPRNMSYKFQFPGPTGTNAVEAALKIARKVTGRHNIISFTNGFHGATLGALATTGNRHYRNAMGLPALGVCFMPYDGYLGDEIDTTEYLDKALSDPSSGVDLPAAVIVEAIQGEGGVNVASAAWLQSLQAVCRKYGALLILDDIQMGCGRTGEFFSFQETGTSPDIIVLSKSLSGYGLPLALVLLKPEVDHWKPGEHTGTFRGNNLAFVTGTAALRHYWTGLIFPEEVKRKGRKLRGFLEGIVSQTNGALAIRGKGMVQGLDCQTEELAADIVSLAFAKGLIIETSGASNQVIKFLPALTIDDDVLERGLSIFAAAINEAMERPSLASPFAPEEAGPDARAQ